MKRFIPIAILFASLQLQAKDVRMSYAQPGYACYPYTETTFNNLCNSPATCLNLFTCSYQQTDFVASKPVANETSLLGRNTPFNHSQYFWGQPPSKPPVIPKDLSSAEMVHLMDWLWCKMGTDTSSFVDQQKKKILGNCIPSFTNLGADIKDLDLINDTKPIQNGTYVRADKPPTPTPQYAVLPINLDSAKTSNTIQIDEPLLIDSAEYSGVLSIADTKGNAILTKAFQEIIVLNGKVASTDQFTSTTLTPSAVFKEKYKDSCAIMINSAHPIVIQNIILSGFESGICIKRKTEVILSKVSMMDVKTGVEIIDKSGSLETDAVGNPKGFIPEDTSNPNKRMWILVADSLIGGSNYFINITSGTTKPVDVVVYNSLIYGKTNFTQNTQRMVAIKSSLSDSAAATIWGQEKTPQLYIMDSKSDKSNALLKFFEDVSTVYPSTNGYSAIVYTRKDDTENFKTTQVLRGTDVIVNKNIVTLGGIDTKDLSPQSQVMVALIPTDLPNDDRLSAKTLFTEFVNQDQTMKVPPISFPYAYNNTVMGPHNTIYICGDQDNPTLKAKLQNATVDRPLTPSEVVKIKLPWGPSTAINLKYENNAIHFSGNEKTLIQYNGTFSEILSDTTVSLAFKTGSSRPKIVIAQTNDSGSCMTSPGIQWDEENKIRIKNYDANKTAGIATVKMETLNPFSGFGGIGSLPSFSGFSISIPQSETPAKPEPDPILNPVPTPVGATGVDTPKINDASTGIKKPVPAASVNVNNNSTATFTEPEKNSSGVFPSSCSLIRGNYERHWNPAD